MKLASLPDTASFASAIRLNRMLAIMDDSARKTVFDIMLDIEKDIKIQQAIDRQLDGELLNHIYRDHEDGTTHSLLFGKLPAEIRSHIFSYCVAVDQSVHVVPPKGNEHHGFRLSLCDESSYDVDLGICRCNDSSRAGQATNSEFFNNVLFLVSRTVRREALDAFFLTNSFTFTCLYELQRFTSMFTRSCSKIQRLRLFERVDDYPTTEYRLEGIQSARQRLKLLKHLELRLYLASWSAYESIYEDGLVDQVIHFALGPPPKVSGTKKRKLDLDAHSKDEKLAVSKRADTDRGKAKSKEIRTTSINENTTPSSSPVAEHGQGLETFVDNNDASSAVVPNDLSFGIPPLKTFTPHVQLRSSYINFRFDQSATDPKKVYYDGLFDRLSKHLTDVFMDAGRKYRTIGDVPKLCEKPKLKIRDDERPLRGSERRGILFMRD